MATLVFDGDCGFCTSAAKHVQKRSRVPLNITAWQLTDVTLLGLTPEMTAARVYLVTPDGLFGGAECFAEIMRIQGDPFHRAVAWGMRLPGLRRLGEWGYTLIARYRHKLPGGTPACAPRVEV